MDTKASLFRGNGFRKPFEEDDGEEDDYYNIKRRSVNRQSIKRRRNR